MLHVYFHIVVQKAVRHDHRRWDNYSCKQVCSQESILVRLNLGCVEVWNSWTVDKVETIHLVNFGVRATQARGKVIGHYKRHPPMETDAYSPFRGLPVQ
jgi:hypothetical protein